MLRTAILHECQNYLGGRGRFGWKRFSPPPPPRGIIPDARPLGTFENQDTRDGKTRYLNDLTKKIGDCEQSTYHIARENPLGTY